MKLAVLTSGGKDSLYSLYLMQQQGHEIKYIVTVIPQREDSYMFHYPNVKLTKLQAESMGIPIITKETKGEKEKELKDLKEALSSIKDKVDGIVSGAIQSEYQKQRIDMISEELNLKSFSPLWHKDSELLWNDLLNAGFKVIITSVSAQGLDEKWLGKEITKESLNELKELSKKYKFHLMAEGGEFETFVTNAPFFKEKLVIKNAEKEWNGSSGYYIIKKVELIKK